LGLVGGSIADAVDRRVLVIGTTSLLAAMSLLFALQALLELRQLWLLYALVAAQSSLLAVEVPAGRTFIPRLLTPDQIPAAAALSYLSFHLSLIVGPLLAGAVIALAGLQTAYLIDAASFAFAIYAVLRLPAMPPHGDGAPLSLRTVLEGLRFVRRQPVIASALLVDLNATIFGMPFALFPALAATHFGGGPQTVGLLYAAPACGGLIAAAGSGPLTPIPRQGRALPPPHAVWGAAISGFRGTD